MTSQQRTLSGTHVFVKKSNNLGILKENVLGSQDHYFLFHLKFLEVNDGLFSLGRCNFVLGDREVA